MDKLFIVSLFVLIGFYPKAQQLDKTYILEIVGRAVSVLHNSKDASAITKKAYEDLIFSFCYSKEYREDVQKIISVDDLFQLIDANKEVFKETYYRGFLLNKAGCFNREEYAYVRKTLSSTLAPSSEYFYELVGLFQLDQFKAYIEAKVDSTWYDRFSEALDTNMYMFTLSSQLFERGMPLIALANLGNKKIEDRIIELLMNYAKSFDKVSPEENIVRQEVFYQRVLENVLSKLYSKSSVITTLPLLDNYLNRSEFIYIADVGSFPMNSMYLNYVLRGKLQPVYRDYFLHTLLLDLSGGNDMESRKAIIAALKEDILNDKIKWSSLYNY